MILNSVKLKKENGKIEISTSKNNRFTLSVNLSIIEIESAVCSYIFKQTI